MLNWPIYPTESFIACVFHCMITTLSVLLVYQWKQLIKLTSRELIDKIMKNEHRINSLLLIIKLLIIVLYNLGIIMEAYSYHLRYVLAHAYPFMQLFKAGFLCFYIVEVCTVIYFMLILFYVRRELNNNEKIN